MSHSFLSRGQHCQCHRDHEILDPSLQQYSILRQNLDSFKLCDHIQPITKLKFQHHTSYDNNIFIVLTPSLESTCHSKLLDASVPQPYFFSLFIFNSQTLRLLYVSNRWQSQNLFSTIRIAKSCKLQCLLPTYLRRDETFLEELGLNRVFLFHKRPL